ncbi:PTS transporter subunit EIIC [Robertmurraya sp. P23]|uniref:PTS transporter subunit EIIC n=1 Tax=Robertmurraya sp. P23 TaxID=3436931 RepID=UPI003D99BCA5
MKYKKLVNELLKSVGGKENITSATHCFTRLRLRFNDFSKINEEEIKKIEGVLGTNKNGDEFQVIIGNHVDQVHSDFVSLIGNLPAEGKEAEKKKGSFKEELFATIVAIFIPIIGLLAASGLLKGIVTILTSLEVISETSGAYVVLHSLSDAVFYFFPIVIGYTAGKRFGANPLITLLIGAAIVYPSLIEATKSGETYTFFGIPLKLVSYTSSVMPIIFAAYFAAKVEKFFKKVLPSILRMVFVPFFTLIIVYPLTLLVIGPIITFLTNIVASSLDGIFNFSPILTGFIFGGIFQVIIIFGLQWGLIPIYIQYLTTLGYDPLIGLAIPSVLGIAGAVFAFALRTKNKKTRTLAYTTGTTALLGVSEPAIFGLLLPLKRPMICALIGSGLAGATAAILEVKVYAPGLSGIFNVIAYGGELQNNLYGFLSLFIAFAASFILSYFFGYSKKNDQMDLNSKLNNELEM